MTDPYQNIPHVLPGSDAAAAVDEVSNYFANQGPDLDIPALQDFVKQTIVSHGGDPVTAAVSSTAVGDLATKDPAQAQKVAENVVGITLADPAVASSNAKERVAAALKATGEPLDALTAQQQEDIAFNEANGVLRNAGVVDAQSQQDLRTKIHQYMEEGSSPEMAAAAAVAAILAQNMAEAESFSIFGYLTMMVHGDAEYIFKNTELLKIADSSIHTNLSNTTYNMKANNFVVTCDTIKTSSSGEDVRAHEGAAVGKYLGSYDSYAQKSYSVNLIYKYRWGGRVKSLAVATVTETLGRVYLAVFDSDLVWNSKVKLKFKDHRKSAAEVRVFGKKIISTAKAFLK
ncbi:hypothetical protein BOTU111921_23865 [Bordetella tumbae]|uniref:hypothetical protein n=1 Tax=Bordetella tumbae TaxID=1649139 RepID=UPI0039EECE9B